MTGLSNISPAGRDTTCKSANGRDEHALRKPETSPASAQCATARQAVGHGLLRAYSSRPWRIGSSVVSAFRRTVAQRHGMPLTREMLEYICCELIAQGDTRCPCQRIA